MAKIQSSTYIVKFFFFLIYGIENLYIQNFNTQDLWMELYLNKESFFSTNKPTLIDIVLYLYSNLFKNL